MRPRIPHEQASWPRPLRQKRFERFSSNGFLRPQVSIEGAVVDCFGKVGYFDIAGHSISMAPNAGNDLANF